MLLLRNRQFEIWKLKSSRFSEGKCEVDRPYRLTGANLSRKQKCFSPSCLWSQDQGDTSDRDNSQSLGYQWTQRRRCIYMWSWTEMLTASNRPRARTIWIPLRTSIEICRLGEGHSLCPLECLLSVGKPFQRRPQKCCQLQTRASW